MPEIVQRPAILLFFLILAVIEWRWRIHHRDRRYDWRASLASLGIAVGQFGLKPLTAVVLTAAYTKAHQMSVLSLPIDDWRVWMIGFVAVEFAYYWFHRWSHMINWMWATHAVHHSANEMTLPAAIRLGWTNLLSGGWVIFLPLALLGFPPVMVTALLGANLVYQYGLHTEAIGKLGPIEWVLNTPSHHRAHHASDSAYLDCNFGGVLIIFDRLFGTLRMEPDGGGLRYGLVKPVLSYNPIVIAFSQWRVMRDGMTAAATWPERWAVVFGSPEALDRIVSRARSTIPGASQPAHWQFATQRFVQRVPESLNP